MRLEKIIRYICQVQTTLLVVLFLSSVNLFAQTDTSSTKISQDKNLQLKLSESISIYSEKAYKRNKGKTFEAIGNVVIISSRDTLYGEKASIDLASGKVKIEGNVRFISPGLNIYGSLIDFNFNTSALEIQNARVITKEFNIIANSLKKTGKRKFHAVEAQFTTCKDCAESWSVFGEDIYVELDQYIQIHHALARIKGISVLYFPYIILPIKTKRESGLLFPSISSSFSEGENEGITYEQPIFWNLGENKDMTFSPRLMGKRGFGLDYQYRHVFSKRSWLEFNDRSMVDSIYLPLKTDRKDSGHHYFRNFAHIESHFHFSNNLTSHFEGSWPKDLDMYSDFDDYMKKYSSDGNAGIYTFFDYRQNFFNLGIEGSFVRNSAVSDPLILDEQYIQTLPMINFSTKAYNLFNTNTPFLQKGLVGIDSTAARFVQGDTDEANGIRNVLRVSAKPYLDWHLFDIGATHFKINYTFDSQLYRLIHEEDKYFSKYANIFQTSASFTLSKVFGRADVQKVSRQDLLDESTDGDSQMMGQLPRIKDEESFDFELVYKNSYKHSQEFQFIHHYTSSTNEVGNGRFESQIRNSDGWFDYDDALREDIATVGINDVRTQIPVLNTFEFRWNNAIIKKSIKPTQNSSLSLYRTNRFDYSKIGYFNLSQGVVLSENKKKKNFKNKLTRLYIDMGYSLKTFNLNMREYYFHSESEHKLELNVEKRFSRVSILSSYNFNSLDDSKLKTIKLGGQFRPIDSIGFSALQEYDLNAENNIRRVYEADYMPDNDCWILNFKYRENVTDERFSINFQFNFGNRTFSEYKENYFAFNRFQ